MSEGSERRRLATHRSSDSRSICRSRSRRRNRSVSRHRSLLDIELGRERLRMLEEEMRCERNRLRNAEELRDTPRRVDEQQAGSPHRSTSVAETRRDGALRAEHRAERGERRRDSEQRRDRSLCLVLTAVTQSTAQRIGTDPYLETEICRTVNVMTVAALQNLKDCVVVVGNVRILLLERATSEDFQNVTFYKLREVTGFVLVYRVTALKSLGDLFPNLARIRGEEVYGNYGLIVHDMQDLVEIGLYSLLRIDRGGVIIWGGPSTCYEDTIDWRTIAPKYSHVLIPSGSIEQCNVTCRCTLDPATNHCWNNKKCQRYLTGPDGEECHEQCFGCRITNSADCSVCRHYTYRRQCVTTCPKGTIVLPQNKYCLTVPECHRLGGWLWKGNCIFQCPVDYESVHYNNGTTCEPCKICTKTCLSQRIFTLRDIKLADRCTYINGSLTIHLRSLHDEDVGELRLHEYLNRIEEVSDYVFIHGSNAIISLDFLSSFRRIHGRNLKDNKYSLLITDMPKLKKLFTPNVTKTLQIDGGTLGIFRNPVLCVSEIEKIKSLFPIKPDMIDMPQGLNGYSAESCEEVTVGLQIRVLNETSALVMFSPVDDRSLHYSLLYVQVSATDRKVVVPESCSEHEWLTIAVEYTLGHINTVELNSLLPASTYAICVESYDPVRRLLARSPIANFSTPVGKPAPPFITELNAISNDTIVVRWVDHKVYKMHITHYYLEVNLIEIDPEASKLRNHCNDTNIYFDDHADKSHMMIMNPPSEYDATCKSMCNLHSSLSKGTIVEEDIDICGSLGKFYGYGNEEEFTKLNRTIGKYVKTLFFKIEKQKNEFEVKSLQPYRDYKFKLSACTASNCSRSARGTIKTLPTNDADLAKISELTASEQGLLYVTWQPPPLFNGLILCYSVQASLDREVTGIGNPMPEMLCVSSDQLSLIIRTEKANKYKVRVCTTSLASTTCTAWEQVAVTKVKSSTWWLSGILVGVLICVLSPILAKLWKSRIRSDRMMLIDETSVYRCESEPPNFMMTDIYLIPGRDMCID